MGRDVIKVTPDFEWEKYKNVNLVTYDETYEQALKEYQEEVKQWEKGFYGENPITDDMEMGEYLYCPEKKRYVVADMKEEDRTHLCMFSTTSDSPMSPPFATPDELADWLVANNASVFGFNTGTKEEWLKIIGAGWIISGVIVNGEMKVGADTIPPFFE